jgi:hypothetical protein
LREKILNHGKDALTDALASFSRVARDYPDYPKSLDLGQSLIIILRRPRYFNVIEAATVVMRHELDCDRILAVRRTRPGCVMHMGRDHDTGLEPTRDAMIVWLASELSEVIDAFYACEDDPILTQRMYDEAADVLNIIVNLYNRSHKRRHDRIIVSQHRTASVPKPSTVTT